MSTRTLEEIMADFMVELSAAAKYYIETGQQWRHLEPVKQRRLIEFERETLSSNQSLHGRDGVVQKP